MGVSKKLVALASPTSGAVCQNIVKAESRSPDFTTSFASFGLRSISLHIFKG